MTNMRMFTTALTFWAEKRLGVRHGSVTTVVIEHQPGWVYSSETWDEASTTVSVMVDPEDGEAHEEQIEIYSGDLIRELAAITEEHLDKAREEAYQ